MLAYFVLYSPNHEAPPFSFGNYSVCGIAQATDPWIEFLGVLGCRRGDSTIEFANSANRLLQPEALTSWTPPSPSFAPLSMSTVSESEKGSYHLSSERRVLPR